jgi:hypothetical protein
MTDIEAALQATVQKALSSVGSSRWTLDEAGRREAYTLTVQPTDPDAATVAVTLYGPQITVDVADLLSVELALEDEVEDLAYIGSIVEGVVRDGVIVTLVGDASAPLVARAKLATNRKPLVATSVDIRNLFNAPRRTKKVFRPY